MSVSQIQMRAGARRGRLCPSSFALAGVTVILVWAGVMDLLRQGRLEVVLSAGWAELAAPVLVTLVVAAGVCERRWPADPRPVEQDHAAAPGPLLLAEQLVEPFQAQR